MEVVRRDSLGPCRDVMPLRAFKGFGPCPALWSLRLFKSQPIPLCGKFYAPFPCLSSPVRFAVRSIVCPSKTPCEDPPREPLEIGPDGGGCSQTAPAAGCGLEEAMIGGLLLCLWGADPRTEGLGLPPNPRWVERQMGRKRRNDSPRSPITPIPGIRGFLERLWGRSSPASGERSEWKGSGWMVANP